MAPDSSEFNRVAKPGWTPPKVEPGPNTKALSRFFWSGTWTGTVEADGMGPGSPEMEGR